MAGCYFQDVLFEECKIVRGEFWKCNKRFFSLRFKNSFLIGCNFSNLKMKRTSFFNSKVKECYFNETELAQANFRGSDLEGSVFHHTDLSKADFRNAKNYLIDPQINVLKKAYFSIPDALALLNFFDVQIS